MIYQAYSTCKMPLGVPYFSPDLCYYCEVEDELQNEAEAYFICHVRSSTKTLPLKMKQSLTQFQLKRTKYNIYTLPLSV